VPDPTTHTEILIVGAGLTGLSIADALIRAGRNVLVIEGRDRIGGRIMTAEIAGAAFDLGPAWFWPGQPRVAALAQQLRLEVFEQFSEGRLVFEGADGAVRRDLNMAPMAGSLRLAGGLSGLTTGLATRIGDDKIRTGHRLTAISSTNGKIAAEIDSSEQITITTDQVILAAPPRLLEANFDFTPHLPAAARQEMRATPTWMAGHAKIIAVYPRAFWRDAGLNGDAMSHRGPMAEIHDASPNDGSCGALFGFVGVPAVQRRNKDQLLTAAKAQLASLFGPEALIPTDIILQDWATEDLTTTKDDEVPPTSHPAYRPIDSLANLWRGRLHIVSSETAATYGGFIEGALEAAEVKVAELLSQ